MLGFTGLEEVDWEIWVFDGESDDDTGELARRLADENNRIKYFLNERRLQGLAVNQAVGEGPGEFLLWLGAHTEYPADYLARLLETAQRAEDISWAARWRRVRAARGTARRWCRR